MKAKGLVIAAVFAAAAAGYGFLNWGKDNQQRRYVSVPVEKGNIRQVVSSTGTLQAVVTVQVGSQVSGTIAKLAADFNTKVKKGQVIAELDQAKFRARVEEVRANLLAANANVVKAKVSIEDAQRTLARARELRQRDLIAQSELDAAQTSYDAARSQMEVTQAQVAQARASLNQAAIDLGYTVIRSPVDGIVISRNVDVGQTVAASLQAPTLFTIANDLAKMEVHTNVDEADVGNVWENQDVSFTVDAFSSRRFRGKVVQVRNATTVVQNVVSYDAVVRIDNKDLVLRPGMTANVRFLVSEREDVLTLPNLALRFKPPEAKEDAQELLNRERRRSAPRAGNRRSGREGGSGGARREGRAAKVYVLDAGKARPVDIRLGITDGSRTEVKSGDLNENDPVIIGIASGTTAEAKSGVANPFQPPARRGLGR